MYKYSTVPNNHIATAIYFQFFPLQVCLYQSSYAYSFPKFRNWLLLTKAKTYLCHGIFEVLSVCRSSICIYFFPLGMLIHSVVTMFLQFRNSYLTFFHQVCLFRQLLLLILLEGSDSYGYWSSYIYQGLQSRLYCQTFTKIFRMHSTVHIFRFSVCFCLS